MSVSTASTISSASASPRVPALVWILGWVSLLTDISSEMILAVLPVYLGTVMGVSMATIGLIEGIAEGITHLGLAVEDVHKVGTTVPGVITAKVLRTERHPDAAKVHRLQGSHRRSGVRSPGASRLSPGG